MQQRLKHISWPLIVFSILRPEILGQCRKFRFRSIPCT